MDRKYKQTITVEVYDTEGNLLDAVAQKPYSVSGFDCVKVDGMLHYVKVRNLDKAEYYTVLNKDCIFDLKTGMAK